MDTLLAKNTSLSRASELDEEHLLPAGKKVENLLYKYYKNPRNKTKWIMKGGYYTVQPIKRW